MGEMEDKFAELELRVAAIEEHLGLKATSAILRHERQRQAILGWAAKRAGNRFTAEDAIVELGTVELSGTHILLCLEALRNDGKLQSSVVSWPDGPHRSYWLPPEPLD
jgi:hypothetical protein